MKILVIGSGAREDCLVWKLAQSKLVSKIFCAGGNAGTAIRAENIDISPTDIEKLLDFAFRNNIDLTIVGPEAPLVEGIVDRFKEKKLKIFGPSKDLALLEGSKVYAKELMIKYGIPTAKGKIFNNYQDAKEYLNKGVYPCVIKADGLAQGKGVEICQNYDQAQEAINRMMLKKIFGKAGERIIIEECLQGQEASILVFTDGKTIIPLVPSQDHKRVFDNDQGPNTGGMGAYSPAPIITDSLLKKIIDTVFNPLIKGLSQEGKIYKGILYAGLMLVKNKIYVLEFNVRFGDPETQAILPKLKTDLAEIMIKIVDNKLSDVKLEWDKRFCLGVVLTAGGYPSDYRKGDQIKGLNNFEQSADLMVFHAGTKTTEDKSKVFTNGGRVLTVVSLADTIAKAQDKVYSAIKNINFKDMHYRKDIGSKA